MDTRFWGPYGWTFLHTLPFSYNPNNTLEKKSMKILLKGLSNLLPCKYCRQSYSKYIKELPIDKYIDSPSKLSKWTYLLHNKVNDKLRSQGLLNTDNPTYVNSMLKYKYIYDKCMTNNEIPGIDFIYIIAFHYRNTPIKSKKNKYIQFFKNLSNVIHIKDIRKCLQQKIKPSTFGTQGVFKWWDNVFKSCDIKCNICVDNCKSKCIENTSGCNKINHKGITCRKYKKNKTSTIKNKYNKII